MLAPEWFSRPTPPPGTIPDFSFLHENEDVFIMQEVIDQPASDIEESAIPSDEEHLSGTSSITEMGTPIRMYRGQRHANQGVCLLARFRKKISGLTEL